LIHHKASGVLGYLVLGWPDGVVASWVHSVPCEQRVQWSAKDRLLIAITLKDAAAAEASAVDMLCEPLEPWKYHTEDTYALLRWAQSAESSPTLTRWLESDNPSLSATALSLMVNGHASVEPDTEKLIKRFNDQMVPKGTAPSDGRNAVTGRHVSLAVSVYSDLNPSLSR